MGSILARHAEILVTMDGSRREVRDGGIFAIDGIIQQVGSTEELPRQADIVLDLSGRDNTCSSPPLATLYSVRCKLKASNADGPLGDRTLPPAHNSAVSRCAKNNLCAHTKKFPCTSYGAAGSCER